MSKDEKKGRNNKKSGLGLAVWILAFLIILIIFLVKSEDIKTNLQNTRFFERIFGKTPTFITEHKSKQKSDDLEKDTIIEIKKSVNRVSENAKERVEKPSKEINKEDTQQPKKDESSKEENKVEIKKVDSPKKTIEAESKAKEAIQEKNKSANQESNKKVVAPSVPKTQEIEKIQPVKQDVLKAKICFVAIDSDGPIVRKEVTRNVSKDSPLTNCINSLITGPNAYEKSIGCMTLIPEGTKLYSVSVKNGVALMNFSEEFEFNQYGVEGYLGQLMQIVYTATNFSTVQSVQILIEGKKKEYLGSEGVWIGSPLSKASFR